ncbi:hypothetical protein NL676_008856 [Syzygium grande]|nr:hypothetical protein NL676_008856 [Syzygium grande]
MHEPRLGGHQLTSYLVAAPSTVRCRCFSFLACHHRPVPPSLSCLAYAVQSNHHQARLVVLPQPMTQS